MPLQISEIGVHLAVGGGNAAASGEGGGKPAGGGGAGCGGDGGQGLSESDREDVVQACVAEVLRMLRVTEGR